MTDRDPKLQDRTFLFRTMGHRNFSGKLEKGTPEGQRYFFLRLIDAEATVMLEEGWEVKYLQSHSEGDISQAFLKVRVGFAKHIPQISVVAPTGEFLVHEDRVGILDDLNIFGDVGIDVVVWPYYWSVGHNKGIKANLRKLDIFMNSR